MRRTWKAHARAVIRKVHRKAAGKSDGEIMAALTAAYPFGPRDRESVAYRIWMEQIKLLVFPDQASPRK
jgi:hypothetical protein